MLTLKEAESKNMYIDFLFCDEELNCITKLSLIL